VIAFDEEVDGMVFSAVPVCYTYGTVTFLDEV